MPQPMNVEKRLSRMLAKQESLLIALQSLAESHGGDGEGGEGSNESDDVGELAEGLRKCAGGAGRFGGTVHYAAMAEVEEPASGAVAG